MRTGKISRSDQTAGLWTPAEVGAQEANPKKKRGEDKGTEKKLINRKMHCLGAELVDMGPLNRHNPCKRCATMTSLRMVSQEELKNESGSWQLRSENRKCQHKDKHRVSLPSRDTYFN